jgi:hypothetical protein
MLLDQTATGLPSDAVVAHLGTPTTFVVGRDHYTALKHVLLERNVSILDALRASDNVYRIDLTTDEPPSLEAHAALVDPPRYPLDTHAFFVAASRVYALGARIVLCQPTLATRPGVAEERASISAARACWSADPWSRQDLYHRDAASVNRRGPADQRSAYRLPERSRCRHATPSADRTGHDRSVPPTEASRPAYERRNRWTRQDACGFRHHRQTRLHRPPVRPGVPCRSDLGVGIVAGRSSPVGRYSPACSGCVAFPRLRPTRSSQGTASPLAMSSESGHARTRQTADELLRRKRMVCLFRWPGWWSVRCGCVGVCVSVPEGVGEGPAVRVDDRGWVEVDASAVDGDVPALQVDLLVVHRA